MNSEDEMPQKQPSTTHAAQRRVLIGAAMLCALGAALIGAAFFYATTRDFQQRLAALVVRDLRAEPPLRMAEVPQPAGRDQPALRSADQREVRELQPEATSRLAASSCSPGG